MLWYNKDMANEKWTDPEGQRWWVHEKDKCDGERCIFHNPTEHGMREWPIILRETGLIERRCEHGVGHPDPDSVDFFLRTVGEGWDVHGCDGCCIGIRTL